MGSTRILKILLLNLMPIIGFSQCEIKQDSLLNGPIQRLDHENLFYRIDWYSAGVLDSTNFYSYICKKRKIYNVGELSDLPRFANGKTFKQYIQERIEIPSYYDGFGKILVTAIIEVDGSLSHIRLERILRGCVGCNKEALNVIKAMPIIVPGKANNQYVPCFYVFLVNITP